MGIRGSSECVRVQRDVSHSRAEAGQQLGFKELLLPCSQVKELEALGGEPCSA